MARCKRCNSFKAVGEVETKSPGYLKTWVQDTPSTGHAEGGAHQVRSLCMSCIVKLESWMDGRDVRLPGQSALEFDDTPDTNRGSMGPFSPLLAWLVDAGSWED